MQQQQQEIFSLWEQWHSCSWKQSVNSKTMWTVFSSFLDVFQSQHRRKRLTQACCDHSRLQWNYPLLWGCSENVVSQLSSQRDWSTPTWTHGKPLNRWLHTLLVDDFMWCAFINNSQQDLWWLSNNLTRFGKPVWFAMVKSLLMNHPLHDNLPKLK